MHAIVRKVSKARLLVLVLIAVFAAVLVQGQQRVQVNVPYPFIVSSHKLPAGDYTFTMNEYRVNVGSQKGDTASALFLSRLSGPNAFLQGGSLVFDVSPEDHILSEIWWPSGEGVLLHNVSKGHTRAVLSFTELSQKGTVSGKTAYNLTCARCHGADGKGNPSADQYFNTPIPHLASPEVQKKSDAEIKEIIAKGTETMPPVEVEESGFRHRLPPQDVDAVVAYVRTLKQ